MHFFFTPIFSSTFIDAKFLLISILTYVSHFFLGFSEFTVPLKTEQKYATFSVRIHTEYIDKIPDVSPRPKRILVVLWPFFTIRSHMPMRLNVYDKEHNKSYAVDGKGGCTDLQIPGTFDTEHEFSLDLGYEIIST